MIEAELAALRRNYSKSELSEASVDADPFAQFAAWFNEAVRSELLEPSAMTVSTVGLDLKPAARVVLLKGFDHEGFVFFTNYNSRKGRQLSENPQAAAHFFWPELERQINIEGRIEKVSAAESDDYFASRPFESRVGAWASSQSDTLGSRGELERRYSALLEKFADGNVPRPLHWGGYRLFPDRIEFWQGRESRLHDRILYTLTGAEWNVSRLSP